MNRWLRRLLIAAVVVVAVVALRRFVFAPESLAVTVAPVERGTVEATVTNSRAGSVKARRRAKLSPEIGGQVLRVPFEEGDRVAAGDVLLELDAASQRARAALAEREAEAAAAERKRACLAAERAARELERFRRLAAEAIVSADLLDQMESSAETAAAGCEAAGATALRAAAAIDVARAELGKTVLRAPFAGVVAEVAVEVGEWTTPSPPALPVPPVIDLLDPDSIYISAPMDEVDSAAIAVGLPARVTVDSYRDRTFAGRVVRVAPYVVDREEQNRTVTTDVELEDRAAAARLLPGTSADVEVILEVRDEVLRVPTAAIQQGGSVLVVSADGVLEERTVTTGLANWDFTEVVSGVAEGDRVVVSLDREEIRAGAEVVVEAAEAP